MFEHVSVLSLLWLRGWTTGLPRLPISVAQLAPGTSTIMRHVL